MSTPGGMTRRDFLNGVAVSIGAALAPSWSVSANAYPPALTGLRGSTDDAATAAHALRDGLQFAWASAPSEGEVDLVVVGAGISGLTAAYAYRQRHPRARILILDNHDDFGGHARRCEMHVGDRLLISYGGSESIQSPSALWSDAALAVLRDLGVDLSVFETAFNRTLYPDLGMSRGLFFPRETFGIDKLVTGDPTPMVADDIPPDRLNARSASAFVREFPLDAADRQKLLRLYTEARNLLPRRSLEQKMELLASISYRDFLTRHWGLSPTAARAFQKRPHDFFAVGIDLLPALEASSTGYPGFDGLGLPSHPDDRAKTEDPYIHHFPDGNASLARLLVRRLIPDTASGSTMHDIVTATFDYSRLDLSSSATRLRLNSTVIGMANVEGGRVDIGYVRGGTVKRIRARHAVFAGYNMMLPYVLPELTAEQRAALAIGVKAPLVYVKLALRNWRAWAKAGVHEVTGTTGFYSRIKLDYPVSLGTYRFAKSPDEPIIAHLVHVPIPDDSPDQRTAWREGRRRLVETSFATFEARAFDELARILGKDQFDPERDVTGITVYRWAHGYAYGFNSLFDEERMLALQDVARRPVGNVTIANSDAAWSAYAHEAIDQALRAVFELRSD